MTTDPSDERPPSTAVHNTTGEKDTSPERRKLRLRLGQTATIRERPRRSFKTRALAVGALTAVAAMSFGLLERSSRNNQLANATTSEQGIIEQSRLNGGTCLSDGLILHAGIQLRSTPDVINSKLGGLAKGNVVSTIQSDHSFVARQPKLTTRNDGSKWMSVVVNGNTLDAKQPQTSAQIAAGTVWADLEPLSSNTKGSDGKPLIEPYDVRSTTMAENSPIRCGTNDAGQTIVNSHQAAFGVFYSDASFQQALKLAE